MFLAYFRTHTAPYTLHIPLANLRREDLALRPELRAVLRPAGLETTDLLTLTDLPDLRPESTRWLLVDHNALTGALSAPFGDRIVGCIDHHEEEGRVPRAAGGEPRIIEVSGSCMSLVVNHCRERWGELEAGKTADAALAHLALGPILVDTVNLTSKEKTKESDVRAAEFAESLIAGAAEKDGEAGAYAGGYDRTAYWNEINRLKEEIGDMSFRDILRKDYKEWTDGGLKLGMSTIVQGFDFLLGKAAAEQVDLVGEMRRWAEEQALDVVGVMTLSHPNGVFTRQLLVWATGPASISAVRQFVGRNKEKLELQPWGSGKFDLDQPQEWRQCWTNSQGCSRKQIAPLLREAMKDSPKL